MAANPQHRIEDDVKTALKAGERDKLGTLRMLLSEIKNEQFKKGADLDDAGFVGVLRRMVKQRQESVELYRKGNRPELAAKEEGEIAVLQAYLPQQASEDDIRAAARAVVAELGLSGPAGIGPAMKALLARF
ncbi:MAG: GatB/YqeY domain-containing protein, partial [Acidobacteriota bacterium]